MAARTSRAAKHKPAPRVGAPRGVFTLTTLEQVRAVSDPLRVRLLHAFATESTTKQVAEALGEKPTRLYHHVEALESTGLLRLTRTRQKRGTIEKYFLAVARAFRTAPQLFEAASPASDSFQELVGSLLDTTADELRELAGRPDGLQRIEQEGLLTYAEVHATPREVVALRTRLERELQAAAKRPASTRSTASQRRFRLLVALFPLDVDEEGGDPGSSSR